MLRILVADHHEVVRRGVRALINGHREWTICGEASDGQQLLAIAHREKPDLIILDVSLPVVSGFVITRRVRQEIPTSQVLVLTAKCDDQSVSDALSAGARGYVLKSESDDHLEHAISMLSANRPYFSPVVSDILTDAALNGFSHSALQGFTNRELEVTQLIAEGNCNRVISSMLGISIKTVESHRSAAMRKANARSAGDMVRFAVRNNIINA